MKKSIVIISNYYPPETGAAANRIELTAHYFLGAGYQVQVLCPLPNYPTGTIFSDYKGKSGVTENISGINVTRLWVYATNSPNKWNRLLAMISFSFSLFKYVITHRIPKIIFIQCSPLIIGFFSTLFFRKKSRKIILNISDLWPLAGKELGKLKEGLGYTILERIERFNYKNASLILGQSHEILHHVTSLYPKKKTFLYRNFPDFKPPKINAISYEQDGQTLHMVYAGLLGVAQGICELCKEIVLPKHWEFHIYGEGAQREELLEYLKTTDKKILYLGSLDRKELHKKLITYDITIIPLSKRIYGSVPSKIFEYGRLGLPMVYFGGGEGEQLIKENEMGWVITPEDYTMLNQKLQNLSENKSNWPSKTHLQENSVRAFNARDQFYSFIKNL